MPATDGTPDNSRPAREVPPRLSRGLPGLGHLLELRRAPIDLFWRVRNECGEVGEINLAGSHVTLLSGAEAQEAFFRAPDEQLDQGLAYPFMKPIFGAGVVFDLPVEQRKRAIRTRALRDDHMRGHAEVIAAETEKMCDRLADSGEIDLLEFFGELTTYTSTATLIGQEFRDDLALKGVEFASAFQDLERGTDAFAYVNPYLPLPSFWARDKARKTLVRLITEILDSREAEGRRCRDLLQVMDSLIDENGDKKFSRSQITGMIIGMMLAGHHTSQGVASWALIELLRHQDIMSSTVEELDAIYSDGRSVSFQSLREIPILEGVIKETLRMHPPLIILMRKVMRDFRYGSFNVSAGDLVAVSPAVSNRLADHFPNPDEFDPGRYADDRREDARNPWSWIPFGAGRHKCVGSAFAMMQMKVIFSIVHFGVSSSTSLSPRRATSTTTRRWSCTSSNRVGCATGAAKPGAVNALSARALEVREREEAAACSVPGQCRCRLCVRVTESARERLQRSSNWETIRKVRVLNEEPRSALRKKAEQAARYCPNHVISIEGL